jgi:oxaloacetate decarboxylase alpha subunit
MKKVGITDTILRDAHQSQAATRMRTSEMLEAAEIMNGIGYWSAECWGGATFDACLRFLNEDPWERLRILKEKMPDVRLQMLLRGQNLLGYKQYGDDVVEFFIKKAIENGITVIRMFDALNDTRNLRTCMTAALKYGGWPEAAISYTTSPVHNIDYFVNLCKELEEMGSKSICIKDMANILLPYDAYELVKKIKEKVSVPIHIHTHNTTGIGDMTLLKAIEAGADIVDTALSPFANGTSQPCTESLVATLAGTEYDTGLSLEELTRAARAIQPAADRLRSEGQIAPKVLGVDVNTLLYQIPGGMLSNLISQLRNANAENRLREVLEEVPRVRAEFGYPPLVTPTSQIVGTQAVMNVLVGERYKMVSKESKGLLRGEYGKLPGEVDEDVRRKCIGDDEIITCRPADLIAPELDNYKEILKGQTEQEEDILSYAMFPQVAPKFFEYRRARLYQVDPLKVNAENRIYPV